MYDANYKSTAIITTKKSNYKQQNINLFLSEATQRKPKNNADADAEDGVALRAARGRKERAYPELVRSQRCRLVVFAVEVGGRWSAESVDFVRQLAKAKARSAPELLRRSAELAWWLRWSGMLAVAAQSAVAATLLEEPLQGLTSHDGEAPNLAELFAESRFAVPPPASRLPR